MKSGQQYTFYKKMQKSLANIDVFGKNIQLRLDKKKTNKSKFGGVLSIVLFLLMVIASWSFSQELYQKKHPNIEISQDCLHDNYTIQFCKQNNSSCRTKAPQSQIEFQQIDYIQFPEFSFGLYSSENEFLNESVANIKLSVKSSIKGIQEKEIGKTICNHKNRQNELLYCVKNESVEQIQFMIQKSFPINKQSFLNFQINLCQNNSLCQPYNISEQLLKNSKFVIFYKQNIINMNNFNNPITTRNNYIQQTIEYPFHLKVNYELELFEINTDNGLVTSNNKNNLFLNLNPTPLSQYLKSNLNDSVTLMSMNFYLSTSKNVYSRKYQKLQDVLAKIGGIVKAIFYIILFLSKPIRDMLYYEKLLNAIYQFEPKDQKGRKKKLEEQNKLLFQEKEIQQPSSLNTIQKLKSSLKDKIANALQNIISKDQQSIIQYSNSQIIFSQTNSNSPSYVKNQPQEDAKSEEIQVKDQNNQQLEISKTLTQQREILYKQEMQQIEEQLKQYYQTKNAMKFKFIDYLQHIFRVKKNRKNDFVAKGLKQIDEKLDILYIVNKLMEVDKLKRLLLSRDQLMLFEFLPKPYLKRDYQNTICISPQHAKSENPQQEENKYWNDFFREINIVEKSANALHAYIRIKNGCLTDIDKQLIEMLDEDTQELLRVKDDAQLQAYIKLRQQSLQSSSERSENYDEFIESQLSDQKQKKYARESRKQLSLIDKIKQKDQNEKKNRYNSATYITYKNILKQSKQKQNSENNIQQNGSMKSQTDQKISNSVQEIQTNLITKCPPGMLGVNYGLPYKFIEMNQQVLQLPIIQETEKIQNDEENSDDSKRENYSLD